MGGNNLGLGVLTHELGHNLQLPHSGSLPTSRYDYSYEYNDPSCTMGYANGQCFTPAVQYKLNIARPALTLDASNFKVS
jgi:hypothetical protein